MFDSDQCTVCVIYDSIFNGESILILGFDALSDIISLRIFMTLLSMYLIW